MIYISRNFEKETQEFEKLFAAFLLREVEICPFCELWVTELASIGQFVYALPCHHRIIEGEIPEVWKKASPEPEIPEEWEKSPDDL